MRILLVHNAAAGDAVHNREWLEAALHEHGHRVTYFAKTDDWKSGLDASVELVVAAGGDGTVEHVARHVAGTGVPMAVLPLGTANNVATALGIAERPIPELIDSWAQAERRPFDCGRAKGSERTFRFIESVGVGLLAESIAEIADGNAGFVDQLRDANDRIDAAVDVLRTTLQSLAPVRLDLMVDGRPLSGEYLLLEVMNFGSAGPQLRLVPDAAAGDGHFDVVLAEEQHRAQLMEDLPRYRRGQRPTDPLPVYTARQVVLTCGRTRLHVDDRLRAGERRLELTVERHALTFLV
jgi:diacylglycerol kinase (ATP)